MGESEDQTRLVIVAVIGGVVTVVAMLASLVLLVLAGRSTDDLFRLLNSGLNLIGVLTSGGAAALAQRAWKASAGTSAGLDQRIINGSYTAVDHALNERGAPAPAPAPTEETP